MSGVELNFTILKMKQEPTPIACGLSQRPKQYPSICFQNFETKKQQEFKTNSFEVFKTKIVE